MDLSIIIVNWNTRDLLDACLASVYASTGDLQLEVFVVDNASGDGSAAMVRTRYPHVRIIENSENRGFAAANNQAIALSAGRYVLLLNSDTVMPANGVSSLVRFANANPLLGVVGCRLLNPDGTFQAGPNRFPSLGSALLEAWGLAPIFYRNPYYPSAPPEQSSQTSRIDWVGGACLMARAQAVAQVGPLDEGYIMNSEEVDWCWRIKAAGWEVWYLAEVEVLHRGGASASRRSPLQYKRLLSGKVRFITKRYGKVAGTFLVMNYRAAQATKALLWRTLAAVKSSETYRERARVCWEVAVDRSWA